MGHWRCVLAGCILSQTPFCCTSCLLWSNWVASAKHSSHSEISWGKPISNGSKDFNITSATFLTAVDKSLTGNKGGRLIPTHSLEGRRPLGWGAAAVWGAYTHWLGSREQGRLEPPDLLPFPFSSVLTTVWGIVLPTLMLGHPPSVKSLWKHSYRHFQKYVTHVIPNSPNLAKLAMKVNLHTLKLYAKINSPPFRGLGQIFCHTVLRWQGRGYLQLPQLTGKWATERWEWKFNTVEFGWSDLIKTSRESYPMI